MERTLYALLVGIDEYPAHINNLHGCVNDVKTLHDYLKKNFNSNVVIKTLENSQATRTGIIKLFREHLCRAGENDVVLFHYSGHGSRELSAPEFKEYYPVGLDETLVCYDSRIHGGFDLADKELAVLLAEVARNGPHIAVILDCCHSGSGTREGNEFNLGGARHTPEREGGTPRPLETYLDGYYEKMASISIPKCKHVLMAACDRTQKAWETNDHKGVFTSTLLEVLKRSTADISYADLFVRCRSAILKKAQNQTPQFEPYHHFMPYSKFLDGQPIGTAKRYHVYFEEDCWKMDCGALHGLPTEPEKKVEVALYAESSRDSEGEKNVGYAEVVSIEAQKSNLSLGFHSDKHSRYNAEIISLPVPPMPVYLREKKKRKKLVKKALKQNANFTFVDEPETARYILSVQKGEFLLKNRKTGALIQGAKGEAEECIDYMFFVLEKVIRWERSLALQNHDTAFRPEDVELRCIEILKNGKEQEHNEEKITLDFVKTDDEWKNIQVKLQARNLTNRELHFTLVYFSRKFEISIKYNEPIVSGESFVTICGGEGDFYLGMPDDIDEVLDIFKIIVSTERVDGFLLEQEELVPGKIVSLRDGRGDKKRGAKDAYNTETVNKLIVTDDWFAKTLTIKTVRQPNRVSKNKTSLAHGVEFVDGSIEPGSRLIKEGRTMVEYNDQFKQKPVIFLAFANDKVNYSKYLRKLSKEMKGIMSVMEKAEREGLCQVVVRTDASIEDIVNVFQDSRYNDRIAVFHYGGHANGYQLLLESSEGKHEAAYKEGLVSFLSGQKGLKFIFLNGCSTEQHALDLIQAGIPAVVGTSQFIDDEVATNLSIRFYNGIANHFPIERAWKEAIDSIKIKKGTSLLERLFRKWRKKADLKNKKRYTKFRDLYWKGKKEDRFPWDIFYKRGAEYVKGWNLPEAAGNPLMGIPDIPASYKLPESPFRFLGRYEKKHAKVFFGRSYDIRNLYNRIISPKSPSILLVYGQSGVGKSSLFEAGLIPRLENSHDVIYTRRDREKGLSGTLKDTLRDHLCMEGEKGDREDTDIGTLWKRIETEEDKPLVIILDQAEEMYTYPDKKKANELDDFLDALKKCFGGPANSPVGKLILSYRKEYHPEIDKQCGNYELPRAWLFLEPLNKKDIMDVVTGLTQKPELKERYRNIEVDDDLPGIIANDLLKDENSPIAPVLQIMLTRMWEIETKEMSSNVHFTREKYEKLRKQGIAVGDFFDREMGKLRDRTPGMVDSGLALDVLKFHTTELATARTRSINEIKQNYQNCRDILDDLVQELKNVYLLVEVKDNTGETSLAHDTLAPVVIKEYNDSDYPAQRATHILVTKVKDFKRNEDVLLSEGALEVVEDGKKWMRVLTENEEKLLAKSKQRIRRNQKWRKITYGFGIVSIFLIILLWIMASKEKAIAEENYKKSEAHRLAVQAQLEERENPIFALYLAAKAWELDKNKITTKTIHKIYWENSFYRIIVKQDKPIKSAAFSSLDEYILTGSLDGTARLWDLKGRELQDFIGYEYPVHSVTFSPNGQSVLTVSDNNTLRLWDFHGNVLKDISGHEYAINSVAFSPDGQSILTGSNDNTARLWDMQGNELQLFGPYDESVTSVAFSANGKMILTATFNGTVYLWERDGNKLQEFKAHASAVTSAAFSPDGQSILTGSEDNTAHLWDLQGRELQAFVGHEKEITSVTFSPQNDSVLTGSFDKTARLWTLDGKELRVFTGHEKKVVFAAFLPDGKHIVTASEDHTVRLWVLKGKELQKFSGHNRAVLSVAFSPDDEYVITASEDNTARLWNFKGKELQVFKGHENTVTSIGFSPDGKYILSGSKDATIRLWDFKGREWRIFKGHENAVTSVAYSSDGQSILSGSEDNTIRLWDVKEGGSRVFKGHERAVRSVAFSPCGRFILSGSDDTTARLWRLNGETSRIFRGHEKGVRSAAFSPDGQFILTGSGDNTARLWDLEGNERQVFEGHEDSVASVVFSPDGQSVLTGSDDETVRLWDLQGITLKSFKRHESWINSAAFSSGGQYILTGSSDNTARIWEIGIPLEEFLGQEYFENLSDSRKQEYGFEN